MSSSRLRLFESSVGTKILIALTGLGLVLFLVSHILGNALAFLGPDVFNEYSHALISNPLIVPIEIGLLIVFVVHSYKAVRMVAGNRAARPTPYQLKRYAGPPSRKSRASSAMILSGLWLLVFVVVHVMTFKYGPVYDAGGGVRDLYRLVMESFSHPLVVAFYVVSMYVVGAHLWHGAASAFQSLGLDHPRVNQTLLTLGKAFAVVVAGGFAAIVVWAFVTGGTS